MEKYDVAIIGSGPAGAEAAINLKIRKKSFLFFGDPTLSKKLTTAPLIDNYLGLPAVSGKELAERMLDHLKRMEIEILPQQVQMIYPMGDSFSLTAGSEIYSVSAVILATGAFSAKPFEGEERLLGRGVSYCATCDAPLYRGKTAVVLGYSKEAAHEAEFLAEIAEKVYYLSGSKESGTPKGNVEILSGKIVGILGEETVRALALADQEIKTDGVFILREMVAPTSLMPGIELANGYIKVDAEMQTNLPGCFAAGDCTGKPHQYMRAAGQGQTAALSAVSYLAERTQK